MVWPRQRWLGFENGEKLLFETQREKGIVTQSGHVAFEWEHRGGWGGASVRKSLKIGQM